MSEEAPKSHLPDKEHCVEKHPFACPCGFKGNAWNIRKHRANCVEWDKYIERLKNEHS